MANEFYKGSTKIKSIYKGSSKVQKIYKGGTLIWMIYPENTVVFENSTAGTYTFNVEVSGTYEIISVGGGGGTVVAVGGDTSGKARACTGAAGGSGGLGIGQFNLVSGNVLSITVGKYGGDKTDFCSGNVNYITCDNGGTSSVVLSGTTLVSATGGTGGYTDNRMNNNYYASPKAGTGGSATVASTSLSTTITNGKNGTASNRGWDYSISVTGGESVYNGYGKSSSGSAWCPLGFSLDNTGTGGYVRIKYIK